MKSQETYLVREYLRYRVQEGVEQVLLSWVGFRKQTWEPLDALFLSENDEEYMNVIRKKYQEIKRKYQAKGLNVDSLEIINPHIKNARELQSRLNTQYHYLDSSSGSESSPEEPRSEREEDFPVPKKIKRVRKAPKMEGRLQKIARKVQIANQKRNERKLEKKEEESLEKKEDDSLGIEDQEEPKPAPKLRLDFGARFHSFVPYPGYLKVVSKQREEQKQERKQPEERPLQLIFKLLQQCNIDRMFFKEEHGVRQTYFEVSFNCLDARLPIIFHENYLKQCCSSKLVKFYLGQ